MEMFDGTSLLAAWFCSASYAAHAAFTGLFSLRRLYITHVSPSIAEIHKTAVVSSDASYFQDSARGNRRKNSIQTP
jgi:hypothetical protein